MADRARMGVLWFICCAAVFAAAASQGVEPASHDAAWYGCWQIERDEKADSDPGPNRICVEPGDPPQHLALTVSADDGAARTRILQLDGVAREVGADDCTGWERSLRSRDGRRLYTASQTTCEGGHEVRVDGAVLFTRGDRWVDIHSIRVGGEQELLIRHYRPVPDDGVEFPSVPGAGRAARVAIATSLASNDVIEALDNVDPVVVEAMLLESHSTFPIDSRFLIRLDDAGVPSKIIDVMTALSFPEMFAIQPAPLSYGSHSHHWWYWPHGYGYYHGASHPLNPPLAQPLVGRAIRGVGYTQIHSSGASSPSFVAAGTTSGAGMGGSSGATTTGSGSSGSDRPTRRAVPR